MAAKRRRRSRQAYRTENSCFYMGGRGVCAFTLVRKQTEQVSAIAASRILSSNYHKKVAIVLGGVDKHVEGSETNKREPAQ